MDNYNDGIMDKVIEEKLKTYGAVSRFFLRIFGYEIVKGRVLEDLLEKHLGKIGQKEDDIPKPRYSSPEDELFI